jgi:hypothetical protein
MLKNRFAFYTFDVDLSFGGPPVSLTGFAMPVACALSRHIAGRSLTNRTKLNAAAAISSACCNFQRPTVRLRSKPAIVFNHPKHSSTFLRHF